MKSKFLDSLSDKHWAQSRYKRKETGTIVGYYCDVLEQAAFDAWAGSGRIYQKGVWRDSDFTK